MSSRLAASLGLCVSVWLLTLAEFGGYLAAPRDCIRFGRIEFAACVPWGKATAIESALSIGTLALAVWLTSQGLRGRGVQTARGFALLGAALCALGNIGSALGANAAVMIPIATIGVALAGIAMAVASAVFPVWRSTLGKILGLTLVIWSIAYLFRDDDRVLPLGGAMFVLPYAIWGVRLARRVWRQRLPLSRPISYSRYRILHAFQVGAISLGGVLLFFFIFPFWMGSTFGVAVMGDPSMEVTIVNATGEPIEFYEAGRNRPYHVRLQTGEQRDWGWLLSGRYTPEATDLAGNPLFCRRYNDRDLRQLRFVIRVVRDPASCGDPPARTARAR
jgi:hypothetical protein